MYKTYLTKKGNHIRSVHPPDMNLVVKRDNEEVIASPFKKNPTLESVIEQNNYTNLSLQSIGEQLNRIEQENLNIPESLSTKQSATFKTYTSGEKINLSKPTSSSTQEMLNKIHDRLKAIKAERGLTPLSKDNFLNDF